MDRISALIISFGSRNNIYIYIYAGKDQALLKINSKEQQQEDGVIRVGCRLSFAGWLCQEISHRNSVDS